MLFPRTCAALVCVLLIAACSHPIEIVGEGDVWSTGGRTCTLEDFQGGLPNCTENLVSTDYVETYYAEPRTGWTFAYWENYCEDTIDNSCRFDVPASSVQAFIGATMPPLRAVFSPPTGLPITDIINADGREWAQPDDFTGLSWNAVQTACPGGTCTPTAVLKGYSLDGWHWATVADANSLLNSYVGAGTLGPGPDIHTELNSAWGPAFFLDGWDPTFAHSSGAALLTALTADLKNATTAYTISVEELPAGNIDGASSSEEVNISGTSTLTGVLFYR